MSDRDAQAPVLPVNITRGLMDKLVEKRKSSAIELERSVSACNVIVSQDCPLHIHGAETRSQEYRLVCVCLLVLCRSL